MGRTGSNYGNMTKEKLGGQNGHIQREADSPLDPGRAVRARQEWRLTCIVSHLPNPALRPMLLPARRQHRLNLLRLLIDRLIPRETRLLAE